MFFRVDGNLNLCGWVVRKECFGDFLLFNFVNINVVDGLFLFYFFMIFVLWYLFIEEFVIFMKIILRLLVWRFGDYYICD